MARNTLPPEIIDNTIGLLREDTSTLYSCHLVCRSWVPASKYRLFNNIKLTPATCKSNLQSILFSETLPGLVENLTLANSLESLFRVSNFFDILIPLLNYKLSHIHSLSLNHFDLSRLSISSQRIILFDFPTLRRVSLTAVTFRRFHDLTSLILAHPQVTELNLNHVGWIEDCLQYPEEDPPRCSQTIGPNLSHITLVDLPPRIVEWFIAYLTDVSIKELVWNSIMCRPNLSALSGLLEAVGLSLERFAVSFSFDGSVDNLAIADLARLNLLENTTNLHNLTLDYLFMIHDASQNYTWLPGFLNRLRSPVIEEITFDIVWVHIDRLECFDWGGVEVVLCQPQFRNLKRVVLRTRSKRNDKERTVTFEHFTRTKWSRLAELGVSIIFE